MRSSKSSALAKAALPAWQQLPSLLSGPSDLASCRACCLDTCLQLSRMHGACSLHKLGLAAA